MFENRQMHTLGGENLTMIGQPSVALAGYKGSGTSVAVLDGPVNYMNSAFGCSAPGSPSSCAVAYVQTFGTGGNSETRDHGTNVAGIVRDVAPSARDSFS